MLIEEKAIFSTAVPLDHMTCKTVCMQTAPYRDAASAYLIPWNVIQIEQLNFRGLCTSAEGACKPCPEGKEAAGIKQPEAQLSCSPQASRHT